MKFITAIYYSNVFGNYTQPLCEFHAHNSVFRKHLEYQMPCDIGLTCVDCDDDEELRYERSLEY